MKDTTNNPVQVFLDTNILIDYMCFRSEEALAVEYLFDACIGGHVECIVAAHSLTNLFYILRHDFNAGERRQAVLNLCAICRVVPISSEIIERSIKNNYSDDLEDALQMECAAESGAEFFITRDLNLFRKSPVTALLPHELVKRLKL